MMAEHNKAERAGEHHRRCCMLAQCRFIPIMLLASLAGSPTMLLMHQYIYQRYAEDAGLTPANSSFQNNTACIDGQRTHNKSDRTVQEHVQHEASYFSMYLSLAICVPSIITMPLWGSLSDIVGRRIPIVIAFIGNIIRVLVFVLVIFFHWPLWLIILGEMCHGLLGFNTGTVTYMTAAHIANTCSPTSRTFEMVLVELWLTLGMMTGSLLSGFFLKDIGFSNPVVGYIVPLLSVIAIEIFLIVYTILWLPSAVHNGQSADPSVPSLQDSEPITSAYQEDPELIVPIYQDDTEPIVPTYQYIEPSGAINSPTESDETMYVTPTPSPSCARLLQIFKNTAHKSVTVLFCPRSQRPELILIAAVICLYGSGGGAQSENLSTYVMGYPLCWRALDQAIYTAVALGLHGLVGTGLALYWQEVRPTWRQEWLMLLGACSGTLQTVIIGVAGSTLLMYVAVSSGAGALLLYPTARSIAASMVPSQDQGALMSGLYNMENVSRLIAIVGFNFLYTATLSVYEGIVFLVSAVFYVACIPLIWYIYKLRSKHEGRHLLAVEEKDS